MERIPRRTFTAEFKAEAIKLVAEQNRTEQKRAHAEVSRKLDIANRFKVDLGCVSEVMRMTYLVPDIVEAILQGLQPRHLNLQALRRGVPAGWREKRVVFGFTC